ncbi:glycosyltransferase [Microvirga calopogonii]|uniref:glycosyltransferase n=1 Tax=Microvirga calopogonii TaxID=2078013 RepID=UPI0013B3AAF8|nr:glycosyltransferase [Microvirga calopogonii]
MNHIGKIERLLRLPDAIAKPETDRHMRIALFLTSLDGGGGERAHVMLANALAASGHEVELIVANRAGPCEALISPAVRVTDLGAGRAMRSLPKLVRALRASRPDILVSALVAANVLAALAGRFVPWLPMIAIEHGDMNAVYHVDKKRIAGLLAYRLAPWVYGRFARIFCVDQSSLLSVAAFTRRQDLPLSVMPNVVIGDNIDQLAAEEVDHPWMGGKLPVFLSVGRMVEQKNHSLLLRAFARVLEQRPARLIILGDGPLREELEQECRALGLQDHVDMPGFRNPFPFLAAASALVLSSRWEALPTVVIEAQYVGCPVVVTKASMGTLELVGFGRYGRITEQDSPKALANEMAAVLDAEIDRQKLRSQGGKYTGNAVARLYEREFEAVIDEASREGAR